MSLPPLVEPADGLSIDEVRRYSRHLIIPDVGMTGQKRLKNAKVLVVGAGGLGSPALLYLAAAGVGTLGVVDFDEVDESNLQRQVIHGQSDIGKPKAVSAKESIAEVNPCVNVVVHQERLDNDNVMRIFADYDLIIDGTDNFATRYLVNDAAVLMGKPYVWGSIYRFDGQASVFWAEHGPCYRCLYPEPPPPGMVPSCAEGGVLGVLCASIGSIQVTEAIKLLVGTGDPLLGRLMIYDALAMEYRTLRVRKDPDCAICGEHPTVTELIDYDDFCGAISEEAADAAVDSTISVTTLEGWLKERENGDRDFMLVDVREPNEYEINQIPGSVLIPKGEFVDGSALGKLPSDKQVVLHCKTGIRSAEALAVVKRAGYQDAVHVGGGVSAWVNQIDPSQPSY
ncbi:MAG: sulfur-carrier protein adenylyltransferase/sulfurtransferase [Nocardioidaceae bacterium]|nr:sulfur-carrier protein adenylyltransferase/sulfurtransferase [Nocardioidaceae bacterium]